MTFTKPSSRSSSSRCRSRPSPKRRPSTAASLPRLDLSKPAQHGGLYNYAFSLDGKKLAGASWIVRSSSNNGSSESSAGGEVYLWETRKGGLSKTLGSHDAHPIWLRFTADGKTIASYSDGDHTLKLWKTTGKKPKAVIKLGGPCGLNSPPRMSANGETFVHLVHRKLPIGEDGLEAGHELTCWDLKKKKRAWSISAESPMEALSAEYGVSPDGEKVAVFLRHIEWREEEGSGKGEHGEDRVQVVSVVDEPSCPRFIQGVIQAGRYSKPLVFNSIGQAGAALNPAPRFWAAVTYSALPSTSVEGQAELVPRAKAGCSSVASMKRQFTRGKSCSSSWSYSRPT